MDTTDSAYGDKLIRLDTFDTAVAVDHYSRNCQPGTVSGYD